MGAFNKIFALKGTGERWGKVHDLVQHEPSKVLRFPSPRTGAEGSRGRWTAAACNPCGFMGWPCSMGSRVQGNSYVITCLPRCHVHPEQVPAGLPAAARQAAAPWFPVQMPPDSACRRGAPRSPQLPGAVYRRMERSLHRQTIGTDRRKCCAGCLSELTTKEGARARKGGTGCSTLPKSKSAALGLFTAANRRA